MSMIKWHLVFTALELLFGGVSACHRSRGAVQVGSGHHRCHAQKATDWFYCWIFCSSLQGHDRLHPQPPTAYQTSAEQPCNQAFAV